MRRGPAAARVALAAALAAALLASACGHRGRPRPPLPRVPLTPEDVVWRQRDGLVEARARFTLVGLERRALRPPVRPVLLHVPAASDTIASGWDTPTRAREFLRVASATEGEAFDDAALGESRVRSVSASLDALGETALVVLALGVEDARHRSLPSPRRVLLPARPPLPPVARASAVPEEEGIRVTWDAPEDGRAGEVRVYRFVDGQGDGWLAWRVAPASSGSVFDDEARYGQALRYELTSSVAGSAVVVESPSTATDEIRYVDVYPPRRPRELDAVAETERIRVFWFEGGSEDEAVVVVEREREDGDGFREVGRVAVPDAWFEDRGVEPGARYRYRVHALDTAGNRSDDAGPTEWVAPRPAGGDAP